MLEEKSLFCVTLFAFGLKILYFMNLSLWIIILFCYYSLANLMTNWVKLFTGLLFYSYIGIHQVRIVVFVSTAFKGLHGGKTINISKFTVTPWRLELFWVRVVKRWTEGIIYWRQLTLSDDSHLRLHEANPKCQSFFNKTQWIHCKGHGFESHPSKVPVIFFTDLVQLLSI